MAIEISHATGRQLCLIPDFLVTASHENDKNAERMFKLFLEGVDQFGRKQVAGAELKEALELLLSRDYRAKANVASFDVRFSNGSMMQSLRSCGTLLIEGEKVLLRVTDSGQLELCRSPTRDESGIIVWITECVPNPTDLKFSNAKITTNYLSEDTVNVKIVRECMRHILPCETYILDTC